MKGTSNQQHRQRPPPSPAVRPKSLEERLGRAKSQTGQQTTWQRWLNNEDAKEAHEGAFKGLAVDDSENASAGPTEDDEGASKGPTASNGATKASNTKKKKQEKDKENK